MLQLGHNFHYFGFHCYELQIRDNKYEMEEGVPLHLVFCDEQSQIELQKIVYDIQIMLGLQRMKLMR